MSLSFLLFEKRSYSIASMIRKNMYLVVRKRHFEWYYFDFH